MKIRFSLALFFVFVMGSVVFAHPPSEIRAEFSIISHDLTATIVHSVGDPAAHYIDSVEVSLNRQVIIRDSFERQDNGESLMVIYNIPTAGLGDTIEIKAHCNKGGELNKNVMVR